LLCCDKEFAERESTMRIASLNRLVIMAILAMASSFGLHAQVSAPVSVAPPELPTYDQPPCPEDGDIWTPGYWAWDGDYYWVPGTWVMPPEVGYLWTPPYWGWGDDGYLFYGGYWGLSIGFYGGIDYGYGYFGSGYYGGRWDHGHFFYNTSLNNVDEHNFHNVYNTKVDQGERSHVSFNGGRGGINARATPQEQAAAHETRVGPIAAQTQHAWAAHNNPQQKLSANHGKPAVTATARPNLAVHPKELPPVEHPAAPATGNAKADQKLQKQQEQLVQKQTQQRQQLQQKQDNEHQQLTRQNAAPARTQQVEQQHQQQTQQMQSSHTQQMQHMSGGGGGHAGGGGGGHAGGGGGGGRR
jgi:hypothetical protein